MHPEMLCCLGIPCATAMRPERATWRFLRDSTAEQSRGVVNYAVAADDKLTNGRS